jgi:hypothetical protein
MRYGGRHPTLSYVYQKSGNSVWRCSEIRSKAMGNEEMKDDVAIL